MPVWDHLDPGWFSQEFSGLVRLIEYRQRENGFIDPSLHTIYSELEIFRESFEPKGDNDQLELGIPIKEIVPSLKDPEKIFDI